MHDSREIIWSEESSRKVEEIVEYLQLAWSKTEFESFLYNLHKFELLVKKFPTCILRLNQSRT